MNEYHLILSTQNGAVPLKYEEEFKSFTYFIKHEVMLKSGVSISTHSNVVIFSYEQK